MKRLWLAAALALTAALAFGQDRGAVRVAKAKLGVQAAVGKQYALFIAIDKYREWNALRRPVADAKELRDVLTQNYYIDEVVELYDAQATRANIAKTFSELQKKLAVNDSLFIFYAGHGHLDKASDTGFWIPVDGGRDDLEQANWLANAQIRGYIRGMKTIHVFLATDACFSGDILNEHRGIVPEIDNGYYQRAYKLTSREVLTSGSSEFVPDRSEFAEALKMSLRKNTEPLLDPQTLYNDVKKAITQTTPLYGNLTSASHQTGSAFLFFRKDGAEARQEQAGAGQTQTAQPSGRTATATGTLLAATTSAGRLNIKGGGIERSVELPAWGEYTLEGTGAGDYTVTMTYGDGKTETKSVEVGRNTVGKAEFTYRAVTQTKSTAAPTSQPAPTPAAALTPQPAPASSGFVRLAAGTFRMGGSGQSDGKPIHQVTLSKAFYMSDHEVTQKEWVEMMGNNPSLFKGDDLPVERVSWYDAIEYCNKRSVKEGLTPAYTIDKTRKDGDNKSTSDDVKWVVTWNKSANGYRLPTEAEWEFAARGGVQSKGWEFAGGADVGAVAWYTDNSGGKTHPVKTKKANEAGLYDMSGNVWEWCWDWREGYASDSQTDPTGASSGPVRVYRGGSWVNDAANARSAYRNYYTPSHRNYALGFRLVRS